MSGNYVLTTNSNFERKTVLQGGLSYILLVTCSLLSQRKEEIPTANTGPVTLFYKPRVYGLFYLSCLDFTTDTGLGKTFSAAQ